MTKDAKLYILSDKDWKPLSDLIKSNKYIYLARDITIFQLMSSTSIGQHYAIISRTDKADTVVEEYGAVLASENNSLKTTLHEYYGEPLFGDKTNVIHLKKC